MVVRNVFAGAALLILLSLGVSAFNANGQTSSEKNIPSAGASDLDAAQAGRSLYGQNCSHCHGFNMVNPGNVSYDLRKFPTDDADRFFHSVREGKNTMPAWKNSLSDEQISKIWAYVRTRGTL